MKVVAVFFSVEEGRKKERERGDNEGKEGENRESEEDN